MMIDQGKSTQQKAKKEGKEGQFSPPFTQQQLSKIDRRKEGFSFSAGEQQLLIGHYYYKLMALAANR